MTEPDQDQVAQLCRAFESFTRRFKVAEATAAADNALNALDAQALLYVSEHPDCPLSDVARYLGVAATTMSSSVDRLVRKTLAERRRSEDNRRAVALTATTTGRQVVADHRMAYHHACTRMLRPLDSDERSELIRLTEKIATFES